MSARLPFSRYAPQFNKEALQESLRQAEIGYVFLGKELGARTSDRSCYVNGQVQYSLLARTELFRSGIDQLLRGAEEERMAVMCTEKDPLDCHRTLLVTRALVDAGVVVDHVLADGGLESNDEAISTGVTSSYTTSCDGAHRPPQVRHSPAVAPRRLAGSGQGRTLDRVIDDLRPAESCLVLPSALSSAGFSRDRVTEPGRRRPLGYAGNRS